MVSSLNFSEIKKFGEDNNLSLQQNIVLGRDAGFMLGTFYKIHNYPSVFVYNKKRHFITKFEGSFKMEDVASAL